MGYLAQREGFGRIQVEEDASEDHRHEHEHLMLRVNSTRMIIGLQWKREDIRYKMHMCQISNAIII
jgi:hypothetical protein